MQSVSGPMGVVGYWWGSGGVVVEGWWDNGGVAECDVHQSILESRGGGL